MIENQGKREQKIVTIFDDIYDLEDSRSYYRAMDLAGFRTAHFAASAFRAILSELKRQRGQSRVSVVDFASGYGIASALMRHDLSLDEVLNRYRDPWFDEASSDAVKAADRDWFAGARRAEEADRYYGIDIASRALDYGKTVGIYDDAFAENLQENAPSPTLASALADCDLIVECGSVAHMLPLALDGLLKSCPRKPWVAMSPIRGNDTAEAFDVLASHGLEVDTLGLPPFPHRRFADPAEQARAIANANMRGHDTEGYETTGYFHAQILLARSAAEATPVDTWLTSPRTDA